MIPTVFTCEPGWECPLADELSRVVPQSRPRQIAAGWLECPLPDLSDTVPSVAFARQCLPGAQWLEAQSISNWTRQIGPWLIEALREHDGPWRLHVYPGTESPDAASAGRCELIASGISEFLKKKQRRLLRRLVARNGPWTAGEALVQLALQTAAKGCTSAILPPRLQQFRRMIASVPGGTVDIPADRRAPSRAFAKLREAEVRMNREIQPGELCVDLGSSPGSWAYLALGRGARVIALDRSPLREDLMQHPCLTFVRADAFRYRPEGRIDWLLSDVIAYPDRIAELLDNWLTQRWCRWFCVTVKFRGAEEYPVLESIKGILERSGYEFQLRRLTHNKNEATAYGHWPSD